MWGRREPRKDSGRAGPGGEAEPGGRRERRRSETVEVADEALRCPAGCQLLRRERAGESGAPAARRAALRGGGRGRGPLAVSHPGRPGFRPRRCCL